MNFWRKIDSRGPYKNGKNFVLSQNELRIFFSGKILCSTQQKECFYKLLGSFWKIEFLTENRQPRTLQKWWKFCNISNMLRTFRQFLENWIFDGKSTASDLTKLVKILYYLKCAKKIIFWQNSLFHSSKEVFLQTFRQFLENWIFDGKSTAATLQKWWKFCTISKCAKKTFFGKILYSTHQKKCFYKLLSSFCKIKFLTENRQLQTLQKW